MTGVRKALVLSFVERWLGIVISLGSNVLLARLLTPGQIGIFSVSLSVIGIAQVLRDFGVVSFLIQEKELTESHIRTAFGISLLMGLSVFALLFAVAPWISQFYQEPLVLTTVRICALNFLLLPFCTVSMALLRREMAFKALAVVGLAGGSAGAAVSVAMAWAGFGVVSLAVGAVTANIVTGFGSWVARSERRVLRPALTEWRRLLRFGTLSSVTGVVTSMSMDMNDLAVGKVMGFDSVAVISKAQGLMNLFHRDVMMAIRNVAFPAFAKSAREGVNLESSYLTSLNHVTAVAWTFYGFVSLYALETVRLLFGAQWDAAAPLVPWYCLVGAVAASANLIGPLLLAAGRIDLLTKVELLWQPFRALLIVVAAVWFQSMLACAVASLVAVVIQVPMLYRAKAGFQPTDWPVLRRDVGRSAAAALLSLLLPTGIVAFCGFGRFEPIPALWFGTAIATCIVGWVVALLVLRHPMICDPVFQRCISIFLTAWRRIRRNRN